ncbi:hypothetical protein F5Y12DRAFT_34967 [Xylaria sp. FL1777]|nr:hypothetical protein F5Y12DRAFT_34967 [Xylaria sp. FL1777]
MPIVAGAYWDLLDRSTHPAKRRRAAHAKARTGCATCKRRRVKCDEAKPSCARCAKSGHRCAGYEASTTTATTTTTTGNSSSSGDGGRLKHRHDHDPDRTRLGAGAPLLLRPKPNSGFGLGLGCDLVRASLTPTYLDVGDALYFDRFRGQVLADLAVWCGARYWRQTVLREVLRDKTVQHAALGAAAMLMDIEEQQRVACARTCRIGRGRRKRESREESLGVKKGAVVDETRTVMVMQGGEKDREGEEEEEIGEAGEAEQEEVQPLLPVVALSNRSAHGKAALRHYTASIGLCRQALATEGLTASTVRPSLTATFFYSVFELVQGNVGEADRLLSSGVSLLDDALARRSADGAPALVADDELHEIQLAFDRMRVTWGLCPYFGGQRDGTAHPHRRAAQNGILHFELPSPDAPVRTKQVFWNAFSSAFGQFMADAQDTMTSRGIPAEEKKAVLPGILAQRANYLTQLHYWLPILEDLCAQDPGSAVLGTTKVYAQTAIVFLDCFLDGSELAYDDHASVFSDIVATYERLLPSSSSSSLLQSQSRDHLRFTLDVDLFHIITFTVSKCRDRATRARALRVFGEMTRRQALWTNSGMLAALAALAELEDKGRDADGFLPPEARYCYASSEWDFQKRQMMAVFVPVMSTPGQPDGAFTVRVPINF